MHENSIYIASNGVATVEVHAFDEEYRIDVIGGIGAHYIGEGQDAVTLNEDSVSWLAGELVHAACIVAHRKAEAKRWKKKPKPTKSCRWNNFVISFVNNRWKIWNLSRRNCWTNWVNTKHTRRRWTTRYQRRKQQRPQQATIRTQIGSDAFTLHRNTPVLLARKHNAASES